jgi:putative ABC transport system permease protein
MMLRHLIKLFWVRRKSNALLLAEIIISTMVLFAVVYMTASSIRRWNQPTGFDHRDLYVVNLDIWRLESISADARVGMLERTVNIMQEVESMPGVSSVGGMMPAVYSLATSSTTLSYNGKEISTEISTVSDDIQDVLGIDIYQGRWFEEADEAIEWTPVVLDARIAKELFGDEDPVGKIVDEESGLRVVGVSEPFRAHGELSTQKYFTFVRQRLTNSHGEDDPISSLVVKVDPGSPLTLEHDLLKRVQTVVPGWSITVDSVRNMRENSMKFATVPIIILAIVAAFLLIMVVLGLLGVFWQAVTSRIDELGLRRSFGGTRRQVMMQILGEIVVLTLIGGLIAGILVVQLPLLGLLDATAGGTVIVSLVATLILMVVMTLLSGLYPAWLASKIEPAEAMHYE